MKKALITGITGQDGSYLAEFLIEKGYEVHGIIRRSSSFNTDRIEHLYRDPHDPDARLFLHYGDMTDGSNLARILREVMPDEIYNLGAQSHVRVSFDMPIFTTDADGLGTLRLLEAVRDITPNAKFYQAGSSEMFGKVQEVPQKETTPFYPRSPYACAKVFSHWITVNYRESYNLFACNGILFNHESPRRGGTFVTKKITDGFAQIRAGKARKIYLGNLDAKRDWGYARDYVEAMWLMLQQDRPDDYIIATGETHTVREFAEEAARHFGIDLRWEGVGMAERGIDAKNGNVVVEIDARYFRPTEVDLLIGDASKAKEKMGWEPKVKFKELVKIMCKTENSPMEKDSKIYVAGHNGLVGSALVRNLRAAGYNNILTRDFAELDLTDQTKTREFFMSEKPDYVILAAAKVGGILANNTYSAQFIYENLAIQNNVIHSAYLSGVKKLLFLGSSCIYPRECPQPIKEEYLLTGSLESTNEPYALAKIAGIKMCQSYNRQYGTNFIAVMPTNLYGPNDNFDLKTSHVLPALIRKFHEAKISGAASVEVWGTGKVRREFLYVDDMAEGCIFLLNNFNPTKEQNEKGEIFVNLGTGEDVSIAELAELVREVVGFDGEIKYDTTKPDGTPQKLLDVSKVRKMGWSEKTEILDGLRNVYESFVKNF